jgi:hypothetical protein
MATIVKVTGGDEGPEITLEFDDPQPLDAPAGGTYRRLQLNFRGIAWTCSPARSNPPANVVEVEFESEWAEGTVISKAKLDLVSGRVFDIEPSEEGDSYETLVAESIVFEGTTVSVARDVAGVYQVSQMHLATLKPPKAPEDVLGWLLDGARELRQMKEEMYGDYTQADLEVWDDQLAEAQMAITLIKEDHSPLYQQLLRQARNLVDLNRDSLEVKERDRNAHAGGATA